MRLLAKAAEKCEKPNKYGWQPPRRPDHDSTSVAQSIPASVSQSVNESSIVSEHRCTSVVHSSTSAEIQGDSGHAYAFTASEWAQVLQKESGSVDTVNAGYPA